MTLIIGVVSQKGGVGKSTICRLIATEYASSGWEVLIADMDTSQSTSYEWSSRRLENGIEPVVSVQQFPTTERAMKLSDHYDLIVFDGAPHATRVTAQIASVSDLIILPAGNSMEDLNPQIRLAHELVQKGTDRNKIAFILSRVGNSKAETNEVIEYLKQTEYMVLEGEIPEQTAFRKAFREGKSVTETGFKTLNEKCERIAQSIADKVKVTVE